MVSQVESAANCSGVPGASDRSAQDLVVFLTQPVPTLQRLRKPMVELGRWEIAQHSTTTKSEVEGSSGEVGSSLPGADVTSSAGVGTVAKNCW